MENSPDYLTPRHQNRIIRRIEKEYVPISPETHKPETGKPLALFDHQVRIFNHVFTPLWFEGEQRERLPYRTVVWSAIKKSGKTAIGGAVSYAWGREYGGEVLSVANDKDQARDRAFNRVLMFVRHMAVQKARIYNKIVKSATSDTIVFDDPHSQLRAIPCDPSGEAGGFQSLTVWDELWAYSGDLLWRLWTELQPIPNIPESIRLVTTYAGYYGESELLFSLYEQACKPDPLSGEYTGEKIPGLEDLPCYRHGDLFVYWDHEGRMPWHTPEFLESARNDPANKMRPHEYLRLWENRWTTGVERFLDMEKVDRAMAIGAEQGMVNNMPNYYN